MTATTTLCTAIRKNVDEYLAGKQTREEFSKNQTRYWNLAASFNVGEEVARELCPMGVLDLSGEAPVTKGGE